MTKTKTKTMTKTTNRRTTILGVGGLIGLYWGWPKAAALLSGGPRYEPLPDLAGFRRLEGAGEVSGGFDPLTFVASTDGQDQARLRQSVREDLFAALHPGAQDGQVPVAAFSDYHCPYCRVLTARLGALAPRENLAMSWHEWPILGPSSVVAAQAALAADRQGAYVAFHKRMMRSRFVADAPFLRGIAQDIGIDPDQMLRDMTGAEITRILARTKAVAGVLRLPGTPAIVIGRTVVVGAIEDRTLAAIIEDERAGA